MSQHFVKFCCVNTIYLLCYTRDLLCLYKISVVSTQEMSCVYTKESLVYAQEISCACTTLLQGPGTQKGRWVDTRDSFVFTQEVLCIHEILSTQFKIEPHVRIFLFSDILGSKNLKLSPTCAFLFSDMFGPFEHIYAY